MTHNLIPFKTKMALVASIIFWASAFVGIRAGLESYSPGGLALLRFIIAAICMAFFYFQPNKKTLILKKDKFLLMLVGAFGVGAYMVALNYGEITVSSGVSSFIISQSPIVTTLFAVIFLGEQFTLISLTGMLVSIVGVFFISMGETHTLHLTMGLYSILIATVIGGLYSVLQKPFLKKYHAIDVTAYIVWGATLALMIYIPDMLQDIQHASYQATLATIYLGIFPAAIAYVLWSYILTMMPTSRAVSFLYFMPVVATLLGWVWLNEIPSLISVAGGLIALSGVWIVNQSYKIKFEQEAA
jgi:drug/metabolite transporter (DMT)-like permease